MSHFVTCPYDKHHRVMARRLMAHLQRCERNHKDMKIGTCPFVSTHVMPIEELDDHVKECPAREKYENHIWESNVASVENAENRLPPIESTSDWDDEPDVETYDPLKKVNEKNYAVVLRGATRSEKRNYRDFRRQKHINSRASGEN